MAAGSLPEGDASVRFKATELPGAAVADESVNEDCAKVASPKYRKFPQRRRT
jgi:hypothetical protein